MAKVCIYFFFGLLAIVLLFGGETRYILETGLSSLGTMVQNFIGLSTYTDPLRKTNFPQDWTIYYWAYWMVWCVAAPFFIGNISRGRTIRQTILGGYGFGVGSTLISFIILGNYSMGKQMSGAADFICRTGFYQSERHISGACHFYQNNSGNLSDPDHRNRGLHHFFRGALH